MELEWGLGGLATTRRNWYTNWNTLGLIGAVRVEDYLYTSLVDESHRDDRCGMKDNHIYGGGR